MNAVTLRKPDAIAELTAAVRELTAEIRGMRTDARRREAAPALLEALRTVYVEGASRFTAQTVLDLAAADPHGELSCALSVAIDMDATPRGRVVSLGMLLGKLSGIEVVSRGRGFAIYRLRNLDAEIGKIGAHGE